MKDFLRSLRLTFELLGLAFIRAFVDYIDILVHQLFDVERGQLKHIPNFVIFLIYVLCLSVIFQAALDIVFEGLMIAGLMEKLPLRVSFLFLTLISTVMGIQTLKGMTRRKLDVTRNSILVGIIVETSLIVGDLVLIFDPASRELLTLPYVRLPFLMLTFLNLGILTYVSRKLSVFRDRRGKLQLF